jgi:hypothetical protein
MEEEQTTQWPKEKVQREKQPSTKYTYKTINTALSDYSIFLLNNTKMITEFVSYQ